MSSYVKSKLETPFQFIASKLVAEEPEPEPPSLERTAPATGGTTPALEFVGKTGRSLEVASLTESGAGTPSADALVPQRIFVEGYGALRPRNIRAGKWLMADDDYIIPQEKTVLDLMTPEKASSLLPDEEELSLFYDPEDEEVVQVQGTVEPAISPILEEGGGAPTETSTADVLTPSVPLAPTALTLVTGRAEEAPPPKASDLSEPGTPRAKSSRGGGDFNFVKEYLKDAGRPDDDDVVEDILRTHQGLKPKDYLEDEYPVVVSPAPKRRGRKPKKEK